MLKPMSVAQFTWGFLSIGVWWLVNHPILHHSVWSETADNSHGPSGSKHLPHSWQQAADDLDRQSRETYLRKVQCAELGRQFAREWSELYQTSAILSNGKPLVTYTSYETRFNVTRQSCYVDIQSAKGPRLYDVTAGPGSIPIASFDAGKDGDAFDELAFMEGAWERVMK